MTDPVRTVGVVGTGVIGAGWTVRVLARGHDVLAWDPAPDAEDRLRAAVERDWPSAVKLGLFPGADPSRLMWADSASAPRLFVIFPGESLVTPRSSLLTSLVLNESRDSRFSKIMVLKSFYFS